MPATTLIMNNITDFLMFMFNAWCCDRCNEVFGELGPHIWEKWTIAVKSWNERALAYFWSSLDTKRQALLVEAAKKYYS